MVKRKLIITRGLPGCGKTTWAKEWVKQDSTHRVRFNRDDVRNMLGEYWVPARESFINTIYLNFLDSAMLQQYDIVVDNMNLNPKTVKELEDTVKDFNTWIGLAPESDIHPYEIEFKDFYDVPLEVCIERDSQRENPIGEQTITGIYTKYKDQFNEV